MGVTAADSKRSRLLCGILTLFLVGVSTVLALYGATGAINFSPLHVILPHPKGLTPWLPQGWKFFTKNPRDDVLLCFVRDGTRGWRPANLGPVAERRNAFGLDRRVRAQGMEAALLLAETPASAWSACNDLPTVCLEAIPVSAVRRNPVASPSLKGFLGFAQCEPLPWAWLPSAGTVTMPCKVLTLEVL